jgi:HSP20 family molecular chaperone IbpA
MNKKFKDLLTSIDVLNTLNGGVSEPFLSFRKHASGHEMRVRVPGINKEAMQVEINNHELSVFYLLPIEVSGNLLQMPQVVYKQVIPHFIEASGIKATFENNELVVKLPFNESPNDYNRKIEIDGV